MASNFVKGYNVNVKQASVVKIDANDRIARRLEELAEQMKDVPPEVLTESFADGLDAGIVEQLVADRPDEESGYESESEDASFSAAQAQAMVEEAKENAEIIIADAREEADQIREEARSEGYNEGYERGASEARAEEERKYAAKCAELDAKAASLEKEYRRKSDELEPALVEKLSDIFSMVTGVRLENDRKTITYLLKRALTNLDSSRSYIVHVSAQDYDNVQARKEDLSRGTGIQPDRFEVVEDLTLKPNDCMIESEGGIWDCSLGSQLEMLSAELKILSYTQGNDEA